MIINEPSFESLNSSALRYHYSACEKTFDLISEFENFRDPWEDSSEVSRKNEWMGYLAKSRFDIEDIYADLAQANELALRAKICSVSPYLLLINTENKFRASAEHTDFTELRTLDAVDLPSVVNSVCGPKLSPLFISEFGEIRSLRNKIVHLGSAEVKLDHKTIIKLICNQYTELWRGERWLTNWVEHSRRKRNSHFFDYEHYTEFTDVMDRIPTISSALSKSQFAVMFGFPKNKRRYICHSCCYAACIAEHGAYFGDYKTAVLQSKEVLQCSLRDQTFEVLRQSCTEEDCNGNVFIDSEVSGLACCSCGEEQVDN